MSLTKNTSKKFRVLRRMLRVLLGCFIGFLALILFIRSSWGQNIIVQEVIDYASKKVESEIELEHLFITFDGDIQLDGLYVQDKSGDTLLYSKLLEVNMPVWKIIKGEAVGVDALKWNGLKANIIREDTISGYNFQFLIDAFTSKEVNAHHTSSSAKPLDIIIGALNFKAIDVVFKDDVLAIDSEFHIGLLDAEMEVFNLEEMIFKAKTIALSNASINYKQHPKTIRLPEEDLPLPQVSAEKITVRNTRVTYLSDIDGLSTEAKFHTFSVERPYINFVENAIALQTIHLEHSEISVHIASDNQNTAVRSNLNTVWPAVSIDVQNINVRHNKIKYRSGHEEIVSQAFNPNAFELNDLILAATEVNFNNKEANLNLNTLRFKEASGINVQKMSFKGHITDQKVEVTEVYAVVNNNMVSGRLSAEYSSLAQFMASPETTEISVDIPKFNIMLKEIFRFQPDLKQNEYLNKLSTKRLTGHLTLGGSMNALTLSNTSVNWGKSTALTFDGTIDFVTDVKSLSLQQPNFEFKTTRSDLLQIINEEELNMRLPDTILLSGNVSGNLEALALDALMITSQGKATVKGMFSNKQAISYAFETVISSYDVGQLFNDSRLGRLSFSLNSKGMGKNLNELDATLNGQFHTFELNNYKIEGVELLGTIKDGYGHVSSSYKDDNLNLDLDVQMKLDSISTEANVNLHVVGADLQGLGLISRNIKTGFDLALEFKGNLQRYFVNSKVKDGVFVYDNRTYLLGGLNLKGFVDKDTTAVTIKNKMLDLNLESNTDPQAFSKAIQRHLFSYFYRDVFISDTITNPVALHMEAKLAQSPLIRDVFLVNVKDLDTVKVKFDFNELNRKLSANITVPHLNYSGNTLDSLMFSMTTYEDDFNFKLGYKNISAGPLNVPKTRITGVQKNNEMALNFFSVHEGKTIMNVNAKITGNRERLVFSVLRDRLILNKKQWHIPENNKVIITNGDLTFSDFKITKDTQSIEITDQLKHIQNRHMAVQFNNFNINEVFNYLNPEEEIATGLLEGDFILNQPIKASGIMADLKIYNLELLKTNLGNLGIEATSTGGQNYDVMSTLQGGDVNLTLKGDYFIKDERANLNLNLDLNDFKMKALETISLGAVKEGEGSFSGNFKVTGTVSDPNYKGHIKFNNAGLNITKLNTTFLIKDDIIQVNNSEIKMSNLKVFDANGNALRLSGEVRTENVLNPGFNLEVQATDFRVLNASKEDNPSLYGRASFNANATLTGDLQIPKLNAELTLGSDTDVTYVLPSNYANIEQREGVVAFVNRNNPKAILTQTEEQTATVTGFDILAELKINKEAAVTVVLDENSGDNFRVLGDGDFMFTMSPNGRLSLTGVYEISDGHYELNLYNIVDRKFSLEHGSRVSWSGDPFNAALNVRAIYDLKTSASALMAAQISNEDTAIRNKYKQVLPFNVYLNIDGELLQPKISFNLGMPEEKQGAIGGQVYGRIQQVNQQKDELNRQVFSLLVLNRFYPNSGSDGSSGGFATIARDNLNDAVSGQLNTFSNNLLEGSGIELDFGLNSFTDYQGDAPTDRTQLDIAAQKKLFNERLVVRVGSEVDIQGGNSTGESSPLIGNVSLEYKLTEDGRYRFKGFRKSEFENVIDGQTIISGLALIFTKEFNEFRELWDAILGAQKTNSPKKNPSSHSKNRGSYGAGKRTSTIIEKKSKL